MVANVDANLGHQREVVNRFVRPVAEGKAEEFTKNMENRFMNQQQTSQQLKDSSSQRINQGNDAHGGHHLHHQNHHKKNNHHNLGNKTSNQANMQGVDPNIQADIEQNVRNNHEKTDHLVTKNKTGRATARQNSKNAKMKNVASQLRTLKGSETELDSEYDEKNQGQGGDSGGEDEGGSSAGDQSKHQGKKKDEKRKKTKSEYNLNARRKHIKNKDGVTIKRKSKISSIEKRTNRFESVLTSTDNLDFEQAKKLEKRSVDRKIKQKKRQNKKRDNRSNDEMVKKLMNRLVSRATLLYDDDSEDCELQMHLTGRLIENTKIIMNRKAGFLYVIIYVVNYSSYVYFQRHLDSLKKSLFEGVKHKSIKIDLKFVRKIPELDEEAEIFDLLEISDEDERLDKKNKKNKKNKENKENKN